MANKRLSVTVSASEPVTNHVIPPAPPIGPLINRQMSRRTSTVDGLIGCEEKEMLTSVCIILRYTLKDHIVLLCRHNIAFSR
jgi:hypothetical protein